MSTPTPPLGSPTPTAAPLSTPEMSTPDTPDTLPSATLDSSPRTASSVVASSPIWATIWTAILAPLCSVGARALRIRRVHQRALVVGGLCALLLALAWWGWRSLLSSTDPDDPSHGLFPMRVGMGWHYQLETDMRDELLIDKLHISLDRVVELSGWDTWVRRNSSGMEYYIRRDEQGIRRVASRTDVQEEAVLDAKPRFILKTPLKIGDTWEAPTAPYLLRRPNEYPRDLIQTHQALMTYKVESLQESVEVPYGQFKGCALVRGEAALRLFTDPNSGFNDVPLVSREWYCPGAGLVQFEREEIVPMGQFMSGGKIRYVLTAMD